VSWLNERYPADSTAQLDLFLPCLLLAGAPSFSHLSLYAQKYHDVFTTLLAGKDDIQLAKLQEMVINSVCEFWHKSSGHLPIVIDKLLTLNYLQIDHVIQWVFKQISQHHVNNPSQDEDEGLENLEKQAVKQLFYGSMLWEILELSCLQQSYDQKVAEPLTVIYSVLFKNFAQILHSISTTELDKPDVLEVILCRLEQFARIFCINLSKESLASIQDYFREITISEEVSERLDNLFQRLDTLSLSAQ